MTAEPSDAEPARDTLNPQIVAAVALVDAAAANGSPAVARAALEQIVAHSANLAMLNAVAAQQNAQVSANAVVLAAANRILRVREVRTLP